MIYISNQVRDWLAFPFFFSPPNGRGEVIWRRNLCLFSVISCELISIPLFSILSKDPKDVPPPPPAPRDRCRPNSLRNENECAVSLRGQTERYRARRASAFSVSSSPLPPPVHVWRRAFRQSEWQEKVDRGANYPSWTALSSRRVELEQQSGDETEEEHSQQDCQMFVKCCQSTEARGAGNYCF